MISPWLHSLDLIYKWHPWLFGEVPSHLSFWQIPPGPLRSKVVGVQMAVWSTPASTTFDELAARVPAMMDRAWAPQAMRSFADYQARANKTNALLQRLVSANYTA